MSGRSRSFYHGVPRIMENTLPSYFEGKEGDDEVMSAVKRFMKGARCVFCFLVCGTGLMRE